MRWSEDVGEADWIGPRLSPFDSGFVTSVVPAGFAAYARILHPLTADSGARVRWSDVAAWSGLPLLRYSSFVDIALPEQLPSAQAPWDGDPPAEGTLGSPELAALTDALGRHSRPPYWFAVWDGFGWEGSPTLSAAVTFVEDGELDPTAEPARAPADPVGSIRQVPAPDDPIPPEVRSGPRVRLPNREYFLYTGDIDDAGALLDTQDQSPNLWWPAERTWCVASEIDLPWTYVGGPASLIDELLAEARLEAQQVEPTDSHWRHTPGWVAGLADRMADELLRHGRTSVRTAAGTVQARLGRAALGRRKLEVNTTSLDGSRSWGSECVTSRRGPGLRAELADLLADGITDPVR